MTNLFNADCLDALRSLESNSLDSMVTDPPAGIAFMGKDWDKDKGGRDAWIAWMTDVMRECLRVLKPGAHGLVWALPRTSHWTATALELAGFEVRDVITHLFGTGFPKSLDVSKAIDKAAGAERPVISSRTKAGDIKGGALHAGSNEIGVRTVIETTSPATDDAKRWQGYGTALKPAVELWWLVRKPLGEKTVVANVLKYGTGALNIDGCRIGSDTISTHGGGDKLARMKTGESAGVGEYRQHTGRFPANLVLTCCDNDPHDEDCAVRLLDEQSGERPAGYRANPSTQSGSGFHNNGGAGERGYKDLGGASRFFYCAKASKSDRNHKVKREQASNSQVDQADELPSTPDHASGRDSA